MPKDKVERIHTYNWGTIQILKGSLEEMLQPMHTRYQPRDSATQSTRGHRTCDPVWAEGNKEVPYNSKDKASAVRNQQSAADLFRAIGLPKNEDDCPYSVVKNNQPITSGHAVNKIRDSWGLVNDLPQCSYFCVARNRNNGTESQSSLSKNNSTAAKNRLWNN